MIVIIFIPSVLGLLYSYNLLIMDHLIKTRSFTYNEYNALVAECALNGSTTGPVLTPEKIEATKLNAHRMQRINKQFEPDPQLADLIRSIKKKMDWVVISEAWCGDSAQCLPMIAKLAELNPNISLKIILRDENDEFMNAHTTGGSRSIPKLICYDSLSDMIIGEWGPRPSEIGNKVKVFKKENPEISHDDFVKELHLWYAKDKGLSLQADFFVLIKDCLKS
ncbi:MAG TPA: thioredoxin family protein [Bacteroidia bacterium]|nr:thioredoxin family protein [Bacteroidia bacterium]